MAMNKYMHPRNIYKKPPNFKQLAVDYPEFRSFIIQDVTGKVSIDFKDAKTLRALTCTLMKKDFGLDVDIPLTRMIPTVPLRLNYILWLEDLLNISPTSDDIKGVDIGTGASCIYPLLGAKSKGWHMIGTDVDAESLEWAQRNVDRNSLGSLIKLKKVTDGVILKEAIEGEFDFCMCNPPFFASAPELNPQHKARRIDRPRPRNAFCASTNEVIADGGEVNFIQKMIKESKELGKSIRIYSTMVGHKYNLPQLKKLLREVDVISFKQTDFYQGKTTRWGLAWTFHDIDLRTLPEATVACAKKLKSKVPLHHKFVSQHVPEVAKMLTDIFEKLQCHVEVVKQQKTMVHYHITASSNTWSHQRRKRREEERLKTLLGDNNNCPASTSEEIKSTSELIANMNVSSPKGPSKRELEEEGYYNIKRIKMDSGDIYEECFLKCSVIVKKDSSDVAVDFVFIEGLAGREGVHQIFQYVKNNIKA
ncbi:hypothetical protein PPYR_14603 [Photinus pyralis]|uniref:U6 small nuclear RNA (adenine-(43)-N(6))-methyltransferase n=2 Tax=Photinus pyralis TaxID=7054 RepID=A0A5N4A5M5_PHOPY|nr:U6 small nuclear RNA (adenine-(43)-N(6))-methyltransferase [Photinus pyralis]KAB0792644.1 hypothetical protein PPYR_14603 [Photinus pyralis]